MDGPLEVTLPVCPSCHHVGKVPSGFGVKNYCTGPLGGGHKKAKMEDRLFIEAPNQQEGITSA